MQNLSKLSAILLVLMLFRCGDSGDNDKNTHSGSGGLTGGSPSLSGVSGSAGTAGSGIDSSTIITDSAVEGSCVDVTVITRQDLERLAECTSISGDLTIDETATDITNLDGLINIQTVGGSVSIKGPALSNIDGLSNLTSIGGTLAIQSIRLTNIDGLKNLTSIGSGLYIIVCPELENLGGLDNLASIGGEPMIRDLPLVPSCQVFELLERLGYSRQEASQVVCGTLIDDCGGAKCGAVT